PQRSPSCPYTTLFRSHLNDEDATIGGLTRRLDHGEAPKGPERVALVAFERDGGQRRASRRAHLTLPSVLRERRGSRGCGADSTPDRKSTRLNSSHEWI